MITNKEISYIRRRLKENIDLVKSMGQTKLSLNDYYTSVDKIIMDMKEQEIGGDNDGKINGN